MSWPAADTDPTLQLAASATGMSGADCAVAASLMAAIASGNCGATTTGTPGLMMPALSAAISAIVSPRMAVWSRLTGVMTLTAGVTTLVASRRPPKPTSITLKSAPLSAKQRKAMAVRNSKRVAGPASGSAALARWCGQTEAVNSANVEGETGSPSRRMRSQNECRCGDE